MASPDGQSKRTRDRSAASAPTRERLLRAAAELIAEVGWGRVTTRAVATRAGVPHGSVSYHFRGKQELLVEAAATVTEEAFPLEQLQALQSVADLVGAIAGSLREADALMSGLMLETMREAGRDPAVRERFGRTLHAYRDLMVELVRRDQERGAVSAGAPAAGLATLIAAAGDGLLLHVLLDPDLDVAGALDALAALLRP